MSSILWYILPSILLLTSHKYLLYTLFAALSSVMADSQHSPLTEVLDSIRAVTVGVVCLEYEGDDVLPDKFKVVSVTCEAFMF